MPRRDDLWIERSQAQHGRPRRIPIRRVVSRRAMQFRLLLRYCQEGFLIRGAEGIPHQQRLIARPKEGYVPPRVSRRMQPLPLWKARQQTIRGQSLRAPANIVRRAWIQRREHRHQPTSHGRIGWRILLLPRQKRQLQCVRVHRHIPLRRKLLHGPRVVEMAMGHEDRARLRQGTVRPFGPGADAIRRLRQARIDQRPLALPVGDCIDVDKEKPRAVYTLGDKVQRHNFVLGQRDRFHLRFLRVDTLQETDPCQMLNNGPMALLRLVALIPICVFSSLAMAADTPAQNPVEKAWQILTDGVHEKGYEKRVRAVHALVPLAGNPKAVGFAEAALQDDRPEVRAGAATALGEMKSARSRTKLREALNDKEAEVVLAAANALYALNDPIAYEIFYGVLTGKSKTKGSMTEQAKRTLSDPGKMAKLGLEQGIGFIPYGGAGYGAMKMLLKDDASPVRGAAALKLARDPDIKAGEALVEAAADKKATVRAAAISALALRNDASTRTAVQNAMDDSNETVRYTAAAAYLSIGTPHPKTAPKKTL